MALPMSANQIRESIPTLTRQDRYQNWSLRIKDAMSLCTVSDCAETAWTVTERALTAPTQGTGAGQFANANAVALEIRRRTNLNSQALALINSSLPNSMLNHGFQQSHELWAHLRNLYGMTGPSAILSLLKKALRVQVKKGRDPTTDVAELTSLFTQLAQASGALQVPTNVATMMMTWPANVPHPPTATMIPELLRAMILLHSLPDDWEPVIQTYLANRTTLNMVT
ncbi:hypothetical protein D9756_008364 [Leucocoprinus leucothites]|uniref:Gag protein n=1 Tax=Leucocoprinus leucothites TaxID=201217 RepID=A0A8H5D035_9AGAR|nr:hypothetical protein D9756_008364 [Leucoagaricus leucothites]